MIENFKAFHKYLFIWVFKQRFKYLKNEKKTLLK
jgi:hypothetical protein